MIRRIRFQQACRRRRRAPVRRQGRLELEHRLARRPEPERRQGRRLEPVRRLARRLEPVRRLGHRLERGRRPLACRCGLAAVERVPRA